jgi:predicted O-methyltransferase YrrM
MTTSRKLITVDVSEPSYKQAIENIEHVWLTSYVELNFWNALEFVPWLPDDSFDFAFIDARKKWTMEFLRLTWPKVKKWGIIVIDDVIKFREKMVGFYEYLEEQKIVYNVLPIDADDGCMMIIR